LSRTFLETFVTKAMIEAFKYYCYFLSLFRTAGALHQCRHCVYVLIFIGGCNIWYEHSIHMEITRPRTCV